MLIVPSSTKVFLCSTPIDMRQSFDALCGRVQTHFGQTHLCGNFFVFFSRRQDRMKILFWQADDFVLFYKRLERGTFSWIPDAMRTPEAEISPEEFALLISGVNHVPVKSKAASKSGTVCQY